MSAAVSYIGLARPDHLHAVPTGDMVHTGEASPSVQSSVTFIGAATTLLKVGDLRILYDPCFLPRGARTPLAFGQRTTRYRGPACRLEDVLPVDFVVVSQLQGDHFDEAAARALPRYVPVVTTPHAARRLSQDFPNVAGLSTWSSRTASREDGSAVRITALPANGDPRALGGLLPTAMGTLLEFLQDDELQLRVYLSGDMLGDDDLVQVATQYPEIDLALIHLGGSRAFGVPTSMDARQAVRALRLLRPAGAIPIHYDGYDAFTSSLQDFKRLVDRAGLPTSVTYLEPGEQHRLTQLLQRRPPAA